jgi:hypothetical protein
MRITHVIDTHIHADHLSGWRSLVDAVGATYVVHESVDAPEGARLAHDQELSIGAEAIRVLHTPGHTPEHISLVVTDRTRGPEPCALPDHVEVWPGAFAGAVCGRRLSGKPASTIGFERRFNRAFATEDGDTFAQPMIADIPARPENADNIRVTNLNAIQSATAVRK